MLGLSIVEGFRLGFFRIAPYQTREKGERPFEAALWFLGLLRPLSTREQQRSVFLSCASAASRVPLVFVLVI